MTFEQAQACEPCAHAELRGGLGRELESLQRLLDTAVEQLVRSFTSMNEAMSADPARERLREQFRGDVDQVITSLQFHDVAAQMISNLRARMELLELAALSAASGPLFDDRSRLLTEALRLSKRRPDVDCGRRGDVDLF